MLLAALLRAIQAWLWLDQGNLRQAITVCNEALQATYALGLVQSPMNGYSLVVQAEIALLRNNLDDAQKHATLPKT